jgi:alpha-methylacyl-CoA racemase
MSGAAAPRPAPLAGIRVLDLTRLLPGPMAGMHLADMGADVIKVEDTGAGDPARAMQPGFFALVNRNKRAIRVDLKHPDGRALLLRLARDADVLVEGFRPGVMQRLGLGWEQLSGLNPRLVYCAITGYGQDGPRSRAAGHDINYIGYAGVLDQVGAPGGPPVIPNFQVADLLGGSLAPLMGVLAALVDARASGIGRMVDVAMADAVLAHAVLPLAGYLDQGRASPRGEAVLSGALACYNVYRAGDGGWLAVGALERKFWDALCDALGCADLKPVHLARGAGAEAAKSRLSAIFATRPRDEWVALLAPADCCVSPVLDVGESLTDAQFQARGMIVDAAGVPQFGLPVKFSGFDFTVRQPAPAPGEHTDAVLRETGLADEEIRRLRDAGAVS